VHASPAPNRQHADAGEASRSRLHTRSTTTPWRNLMMLVAYTFEQAR